MRFLTQSNSNLMTDSKLRLRLKYERKILEKYYYGEKFPIKKMYGAAVFERDFEISRGKVYRLRVVVGENYPHQLPELFVCRSPKPMPISKEWQGTHITHTWPQKYGLLQICFYHPLCWNKKNQLHQVFEKGEEWLKAYENHLLTGKSMKEILPPMKPTEEELKEGERCNARYERHIKNLEEEVLRRIYKEPVYYDTDL